MLYKPKFCCECGEKVERVEWQPWTSRKFCSDCEKPFESHSRVRKAVGATAFLLLGVFAAVLVQPSKQAVMVQSKQAVAAPIASPVVQATSAKTQTAPSANASNAQTAIIAAPQIAASPTAAAPVATTPPFVAQQTTEAAYYCGARTQKGTLCTRRVRGAGRCWQHEGKAAMVAQEKLLIR